MDEERAVRAHENRVLRQRLRNAAAHTTTPPITTQPPPLKHRFMSARAWHALPTLCHTTACARCAKRWCVPTVTRVWLAINGVSTCLPRVWGAAVQYERCNPCSACGIFACQDHQQQHWHIAHDDDEDHDGCERYLSKLSLADREEERLQQLEDQWHDEQDSDYDNDDDFMEEMSSSSGGD